MGLFSSAFAFSSSCCILLRETEWYPLLSIWTNNTRRKSKAMVGTLQMSKWKTSLTQKKKYATSCRSIIWLMFQTTFLRPLQVLSQYTMHCQMESTWTCNYKFSYSHDVCNQGSFVNDANIDDLMLEESGLDKLKLENPENVKLNTSSLINWYSPHLQ